MTTEVKFKCLELLLPCGSCGHKDDGNIFLNHVGMASLPYASVLLVRRLLTKLVELRYQAHGNRVWQTPISVSAQVSWQSALASAFHSF